MAYFISGLKQDFHGLESSYKASTDEECIEFAITIDGISHRSVHAFLATSHRSKQGMTHAPLPTPLPFPTILFKMPVMIASVMDFLVRKVIEGG
jgi:hypothetical protein